MKINKQKALVTRIVAILIAFIPLGAVAPVAISESAVVESRKRLDWSSIRSRRQG
jgi:hypothetical protein